MGGVLRFSRVNSTSSDSPQKRGVLLASLKTLISSQANTAAPSFPNYKKPDEGHYTFQKGSEVRQFSGGKRQDQGMKKNSQREPKDNSFNPGNHAIL
jgi:hypothetical protein